MASSPPAVLYIDARCLGALADGCAHQAMAQSVKAIRVYSDAPESPSSEWQAALRKQHPTAEIQCLATSGAMSAVEVALVMAIGTALIGHRAAGETVAVLAQGPLVSAALDMVHGVGVRCLDLLGSWRPGIAASIAPASTAQQRRSKARVRARPRAGAAVRPTPANAVGPDPRVALVNALLAQCPPLASAYDRDAVKAALARARHGTLGMLLARPWPLLETFGGALNRVVWVAHEARPPVRQHRAIELLPPVLRKALAGCPRLRGGYALSDIEVALGLRGLDEVARRALIDMLPVAFVSGHANDPILHLGSPPAAERSAPANADLLARVHSSCTPFAIAHGREVLAPAFATLDAPMEQACANLLDRSSLARFSRLAGRDVVIVDVPDGGKTPPRRCDPNPWRGSQRAA